MEWKSVKTELPQSTGAYIVSVKKEGSAGAWLFEYVGWYYAPGKKWIRYDPFAEKDLQILKEEITPVVVGWMANVPAFIG